MASPQSTADVSVVGLGRVGCRWRCRSPTAACDVIGIDNDPARLGAVGEGRMPFAETGAQELLDARPRAAGG